jgi:hypothetical protein
MRFIFLLCIGFAAAYWVDQAYFGGTYSRPAVDLLRHIYRQLQISGPSWRPLSLGICPVPVAALPII